jgi:hypothetical protein
VQVLYNAQMIRTWSLLLRNARRQGYVVNGRQVPAAAAVHARTGTNKAIVRASCY